MKQQNAELQSKVANSNSGHTALISVVSSTVYFPELCHTSAMWLQHHDMRLDTMQNTSGGETPAGLGQCERGLIGYRFDRPAFKCARLFWQLTLAFPAIGRVSVITSHAGLAVGARGQVTALLAHAAVHTGAVAVALARCEVSREKTRADWDTSHLSFMNCQEQDCQVNMAITRQNSFSTLKLILLVNINREQ